MLTQISLVVSRYHQIDVSSRLFNYEIIEDVPKQDIHQTAVVKLHGDFSVRPTCRWSSVRHHDEEAEVGGLGVHLFVQI